MAYVVSSRVLLFRDDAVIDHSSSTNLEVVGAINIERERLSTEIQERQDDLAELDALLVSYTPPS